MPADMRLVVAIDRAARQVEERVVILPVGSHLADALRAAGCATDADAGIWGRAVPPHTPLADGDRVEVYRALRVDPKTARRERFRQQGKRGTGLFARKAAEG
ncbi:RnfH family protein [Xylophilus sp. Kf1]|nr:RnfH family protein [Xylophilus sp. Kf1]